jgi:hypothetical protein
MLVTLPASLSLGALYENFPTFFSEALVQLAWLTLCGAGQSGLLFVMAKLASRKRKLASLDKSFQRPPDGAAEQ